MKIYEIGTGYTPIPAQVAAATESVVEELTKAFIKAEQSVEIIDICAQNRATNSLPIKDVNIPSFFTKSDVSLGLMHKLKRVVYSIALALKLKKILESEKERVILHFHNQYNLFFFLKLTSKKRRSNAFIAYTNHNGLWSLPWNEVKQVLHKRYFQEIEAMKNADVVFVLNGNSKSNICENLGINEERLIQINNGVNTDIYYPLEDKAIAEFKENHNLSGKKVILQVGSVYENKGQDRAIRLIAPILKKDKSMVYAYAGGIVSQEYFDKIQEDIKSLGIEEQAVCLGSFSPGYEMNQLYNAAEATVFLSRYEGFPLVCIESLAAGVPVITQSSLTNYDLPYECLSFNSSGELEGIINSVIDNRNRTEIKEKARNCAVTEYSWEKIAEKHLEIFKLFEGDGNNA